MQLELAEPASSSAAWGGDDDDDEQAPHVSNWGSPAAGEGSPSLSPSPPTRKEDESCFSYERQQKAYEAGMENAFMQTLLIVLTFVCLFLSDIMVFLPVGVDKTCELVLLFAMIVFFLEWLGNCWYDKDYLCGLFFFLDLIATLSLIPDIPFIDQAMFGTEDEALTARSICGIATVLQTNASSWNGEDTLADQRGGINPAFSAAAKVARAGRAARLGAKAARLVRVLRVLRALKFFGNFGGKRQDNTELEIRRSPTRLGSRMAELTSQRVIVVVLTIFIGTSLVTGLMDPVDSGPTMALEYLDKFYSAENVKSFFNVLKMSELDVLCLLKVDANSTGVVYRETSSLLATRRTSGVDLHFSASKLTFTVIDGNADAKASSTINIVLVFAILTILLGASYVFTKDAETHLVDPIKRIVHSVNEINKTLRLLSDPDTNEEEPAEIETSMIDSIIRKMAHLLQISFGEAGNIIISQNLAGDGLLQPMLKGNHVTAIFGFCDIRKFTDTTEVLRGDVMPFVNYVASIVHEEVVKFDGSPNRNIGDAFLCVWKVETLHMLNDSSPMGGESTPMRDGREEGSPEEQEHQFLKDRQERLAKSSPRNSPRAGSVSPRTLTPLLRLADHALTMSMDGSGSHMDRQPGFEGPPSPAVGALRRLSLNQAQIKNKIASEASPSSTRRSQSIKSADALASFVRIIEVVGSTKVDFFLRSNYPLLYKVYPDYELRLGFGLHYGWAIEGAIGSKHKVDASYLSSHVEMSERLESSTKQYGTSLLLSGQFVNTLPETQQTLCRRIDRVKWEPGHRKIMELYTRDIPTIEDDNFHFLFRTGLNAYLKGTWAQAKETLEQVLQMKPDDGPTLKLMSTMGEHGFSAPDSWMGFRQM